MTKETQEELGSVWMEEKVSIEAEEMSEKLEKLTKSIMASLMEQTSRPEEISEKWPEITLKVVRGDTQGPGEAGPE